MVMVLIRINDVNRLVSPLEPIPNERQQHAILFVIAIEKRADMTCLAELRSSQADGRRDLFHSSSSPDASAVAPHVDSQRRMSHPVGACPLYFGIGSPVLDRLQQNKHQAGQSLERKDGQIVSLPPADAKVWSIPSSDCFVSTPLV